MQKLYKKTKFSLALSVTACLATVLISGCHKSTHDSGTSQDSRSLASSGNVLEHSNSLTTTGFAALEQNYLNAWCINDKGEEVTCGQIRDQYRKRGNPNYNWDPLMNRIPGGTKVNVETKCNPKTGTFYTTVMFPNVCPQTCTGFNGNDCRPSGECYQNKSFMCPLLHKQGPFSNSAVIWQTSPGDYRYFKTPNFNVAGGGLATGTNYYAATEHHITTEATDYPGLKMVHTLWVKGGIAYHGAGRPYVTGSGESHGCLRLGEIEARCLFYLAMKVGTDNMNYKFDGYGPPDPALGGRPACSLTSDERKALASTGRVPTLPSAENVAAVQASAEVKSNAAVQEVRKYPFWGRLWQRLGFGKRKKDYPQYQPVETSQ